MRVSGLILKNMVILQELKGKRGKIEGKEEKERERENIKLL